MLILKRGTQPDYRLCNMTVTVYHREGLTRQVYGNAFYEYTRCLPGTPGVGDGTDFLLVIPGREQMIFPGDRVILGEGPQITDWGQLNKANFPSLSQIRQVKCRFFDRQMCHCEGR